MAFNGLSLLQYLAVMIIEDILSRDSVCNQKMGSPTPVLTFFMYILPLLFIVIISSYGKVDTPQQKMLSLLAIPIGRCSAAVPVQNTVTLQTN